MVILLIQSVFEQFQKINLFINSFKTTATNLDFFKDSIYVVPVPILNLNQQ